MPVRGSLIEEFTKDEFQNEDPRRIDVNTVMSRLLPRLFYPGGEKTWQVVFQHYVYSLMPDGGNMILVIIKLCFGKALDVKVKGKVYWCN